MDVTACFVTASRQNVFFTELLDALADALEGAGVSTERSVDCFPRPREGLVYVFVPHEVLPLTMPEAHPSREQLRRSVAICTEQPGTQWFDEDARVAAEAAAAIDINRLGVEELSRRGVNARLLQLGYVPAWDHWHGDAVVPRDVDVSFQGGATERRLGAVARSARHLVDRRVELHLFESALPHREDSEYFLSGARKWELLRRSRLIVNIHRSELGYLEWQRVVGAMVNGCVVLSEHSRGYAPLVPGEHFVSVSYESLDAALRVLLVDEERLATIRDAAYTLLREELPLSRTIEPLAETIAEVASERREERASAGFGRPADVVDARPSRSPFADDDPGFYAPALPRPKPPAPPPSEYERILRTRTDVDVVRMGVKQLLVEQRELRKALGALELQRAAERADALEIEQTGPEGSSRPRVSVILTVYNYASLVGGAIASVAVSDFEDYELIVIDDASTDDSESAIRAALADAHWMRARLVSRKHNQGLARGRNLGATLAEGQLLFILDADNTVYPHALGRLVEALDERPDCAFAYGIIEQFAVNGPIGLTSYLGWDAARLRYGNFVDAMAMIRRDRLLAAGGYSLDPRLHGWEDFALWCALADRGEKGLRVPEVLARYRVALHSMISLTNVDASSAWGLLVDRFACLTAPLDEALRAP